MSKSTAFVLSLASLLLLAACTVVFPSFEPAAFLTALVTVTASYIGLQVVNNGVKGKTFNSEMWNKEHEGGRHGEQR